jgi:hypothetical protein
VVRVAAIKERRQAKVMSEKTEQVREGLTLGCLIGEHL